MSSIIDLTRWYSITKLYSRVVDLVALYNSLLNIVQNNILVISILVGI
jgi:hypothetical protein